MEYLVTWTIVIQADSPREAALAAQAIQRDPTSIATVFDVVEPEGTRHSIDLEAAADYLTPGERRVALTLVRRALAAGYTVTVYDGGGPEGEQVLRRSIDENAIMTALGSTDEDSLLFFDADGRCIGFVSMVWGNAPDGSELPSDHTDNAAMRALVDGVGA